MSDLESCQTSIDSEDQDKCFICHDILTSNPDHPWKRCSCQCRALVHIDCFQNPAIDQSRCSICRHRFKKCLFCQQEDQSLKKICSCSYSHQECFSNSYKMNKIEYCSSLRCGQKFQFKEVYWYDCLIPGPKIIKWCKIIFYTIMALIMFLFPINTTFWRGMTFPTNSEGRPLSFLLAYGNPSEWYYICDIIYLVALTYVLAFITYFIYFETHTHWLHPE